MAAANIKVIAKDHHIAVLAAKGAWHSSTAFVMLIPQAHIVHRTSQANTITSGPIQPPDKMQFALHEAWRGISRTLAQIE